MQPYLIVFGLISFSSISVKSSTFSYMLIIPIRVTFYNLTKRISHRRLAINISNCFFFSNKAKKAGGALFSTGNVVNVKMSIFKQNNALYGGGRYMVQSNM
jgi:predicted outer membrane repeat protein